MRPAFDLLVNRMSPSAWTRGHGHAIQSTLAYLHYVERWGIPIVNGLDAWRLEISKSAQLDLFERLGVPYPRARVINHASQAAAAAEGLRFPVVVKPNIGGSGAGIQRFDAMAELWRPRSAAGSVALGMDDTALVQEFLPARGGHITRLEILQHQLLYAIAITPPKGHGFNLCPADICQVGRESESPIPAESSPNSQSALEVCPVKPAMQIEAADGAGRGGVPRRWPSREPPGWTSAASNIWWTSATARHYFYDVNALSNFVTDAPRIVGFDPFERLVDVIESESGGGAEPRGPGLETVQSKTGSVGYVR